MGEKTYTLGDDSIHCLLCGFTSFNPNDIRYRFCGLCKHFHADSRCDFCMAADEATLALVATHRAVRPFTGRGAEPCPESEVVDDGEWLACEECETLIQHGEWDQLVERAIVGMSAMDETSAKAIQRNQIKGIWAAVLGFPTA